MLQVKRAALQTSQSTISKTPIEINYFILSTKLIIGFLIDHKGKLSYVKDDLKGIAVNISIAITNLHPYRK